MRGVCDTKLDASWRHTPNVQPRRKGLTPTILLMHYTGMETAQAALDILCKEESGVSCHYLVDEEGAITQMVAEDLRAWHAGKSHWAGENDINSCSIGIEIVNEGHVEGGIGQHKNFPDKQIQAVIELSKDILSRHAIPPHRVIGHSDVAPQRKKDPGEKFPWPQLYANGIGHWVKPIMPGNDRGFGPGDEGRDIEKAQKMLCQYGYLVRQDGGYDSEMLGVISAFQRHFRPTKIDGRLDQSTLQTLRKLVGSLPD